MSLGFSASPRPPQEGRWKTERREKLPAKRQVMSKRAVGRVPTARAPARPPSGGKKGKVAGKEKEVPQALRACLLVARRAMSLSLLCSHSGLSVLGATWEEDERELSFFFRGSALRRRASRLQILDDENLG